MFHRREGIPDEKKKELVNRISGQLNDVLFPRLAKSLSEAKDEANLKEEELLKDRIETTLFLARGIDMDTTKAEEEYEVRI